MTPPVQIVCPHCGKFSRVSETELGEVPSPHCQQCRKRLFTGKPVVLDSGSIKRYINNEQVPIVIDFWAPWCGPCKRMAPAFQSAAKAFEPAVRFTKLNIENYPESAKAYRIRSIPTLVLFRRGKEISRISGAIQQNQLRTWINQHV